jgi:predicted  nucleic acid-binding Zn-ribbon protein
VEAAESLLENERKAHALTRKNFATREQELGESISKAANALSESQAKSDDYSRKLSESHERCSMLEAEVDSLTRQVKTAQSKSGIFDSSSQVSQERVKELEAELDAALRDAANSKSGMKSLEDDMSRIQSENFALKQRLAKIESSDSLELQKRLAELTETLYAKQSQIETLAAEKGALQMQLDREFSASRSDSIRRRAAAVDKMFSGDTYDNVVPMQALGAGYERLANAPGHLGGAVQAGAKLLDTAALQAVTLIRQSPLWRLGVFVYLMGMHALMYVLLFFHSHHGLPHSNTIMDSAAVHSN